MKRFELVIYFGKKTENIIRAEQRVISELTKSRACLKIWRPHLTIGSAVEVTKKEKTNFYKKLNDISKKTKPFNITIRNYNFMIHKDLGKIGGYTPPCNLFGCSEE